MIMNNNRSMNRSNRRNGVSRNQRRGRQSRPIFSGTATQLGLETKLVNGPPDPRSTNRDYVLTKVATGVATLAGAAGKIDNVLISRMIPAAAKAFRINKVSVYAPAQVNSFIQLSDVTSDLASFEDYGTQGSVRPQIHVRPALQLRETWHEPTSTTTYYNLRGGQMDQIVVQLTLEVRFENTAD